MRYEYIYNNWYDLLLYKICHNYTENYRLLKFKTYFFCFVFLCPKIFALWQLELLWSFMKQCTRGSSILNCYKIKEIRLGAGRVMKHYTWGSFILNCYKIKETRPGGGGGYIKKCFPIICLSWKQTSSYLYTIILKYIGVKSLISILYWNGLRSFNLVYVFG